MQKKGELIRKLFLNRCTREEMEHLLQLIQEDPSGAGPEIMVELFRQLGKLPEMEASVSNRIFEKVEKDTTGEAKLPTLQRRLYGWIGSAAAAVLLLIGSIWLLQQHRANKEILHQSAYGEVRELFLPDSSLVVLNGNSSLRFKKDWQKGGTRVVRMSGEAYFKVRKKPATQAKFQVITNDLTVEVLGTAFNVNTHKNKTTVFLEEGEVKINLDHQLDRTMNLSPGEAIRYSTIDQKVTQPEKVVQEQQPNWRAGFIQFQETPLKLILEELSEAHRLSFVIASTVLADTPFTVTLPTENIDETMAVLGKSIGALIAKENNVYKIDTESKKEE